MSKKTVKPEIRTVDKETGEVIITPPVIEDVPDEHAAIDELMRRGMRRVFFTPYNHDTTKREQRRPKLPANPTRTQQHQKKEADINTIWDRFTKTGVLPMAKTPPSFLDIPPDLDMQTAIDLVRQGEESFMSLPAQTRASFGNDLARYVGFVDAARARGDRAALHALGLADPPPAPTPPEPEPPKKDPPKQGPKD